MPLLLLTHHVIPWVFKKAAEFIASQLGQSQSPDLTEGLESQTEIQQDAPERPTSATEGNVSGSNFMIPDDPKMPLEVRKYRPDPVPSPQAAAGPRPQPVLAAEVSKRENRPVTLEKNHSVKKDLVMEARKEVQKPANSWKVAKDAGDVQNAPERPTSATEGNVSGSNFTIPDDPKMPLEVRKYRPDPVPSPQAAAGPSPEVATGPKPQPAAGPRPQPVLAAEASKTENRPVTLEKNHSVKKDLVMEGRKEVQKPAKSWKVAKDAVTLEAAEMNSSIFLSSDFPPLQREKFDNKSQKTDVSPGLKMGRMSKNKSVKRIVFGSHFMIPNNLKMPIEVRNYFPDPLPRPRAAARPKRQSVLATETQPSTSAVAAAGPKPQAGAGPSP
ncbi:nascent polypeptide-associated complex subunit alpha, muscle-specific form-like [Archocentrus centrarchus]|uniref:nascent polypeptide-associated complex subunit alpha, muscle-specific form-like n=1 Tax=Archocentrus centrarchus TaxID=63155 RepID=UPI0011E9BECC|nr:nascent polypeptide-associated complex subunit alpha, muscle-specific form-like [Archocentrus centrarchus]